MNTYIVFWTYSANSADDPRTVKAADPQDAIRKAFPFHSRPGVRFLVFEVGGGLVHNGERAD
jgi:hypothetical protein